MQAPPAPYDLLIQRGLVFDGSGQPPLLADVAVRRGRVVKISAAPLDAAGALRCLPADGLWITPGFIDAHASHGGALLTTPGLPETVRQGITTCFIGCGTQSLIYGTDEQPALPWRDVRGYVDFLERQALGPNIAGFVGHADLRGASMGAARAADPRAQATPRELRHMERRLDQGIAAGLLGLCSAGQSPRSEQHRLQWRLRRRGAMLQASSCSDPSRNLLPGLMQGLLASAGFGLRRSLKTTLIAPRPQPCLANIDGFFNKRLAASTWLASAAFKPLPFLKQSLQPDARMSPSAAVARLTGTVADWYGIEAGKLQCGQHADINIIDPKTLARGDGHAIRATFINGRLACSDQQPAADLGQTQRYGRFIKRRAR